MFSSHPLTREVFKMGIYAKSRKYMLNSIQIQYKTTQYNIYNVLYCIYAKIYHYHYHFPQQWCTAIKPLSASCSCNARIGGCRQNGLRGTADIHPNQKTLFAPVNLSLMYFTHNIQIPMNPFCVKNFKTNYNEVPICYHGTERVKLNTLSAF
jgi:hypothetical protein